MVTVFVEVGEFGLTTFESKTETMCMPIPRAPATRTVFDATRKQYRQTTLFAYLGGTINETPNLSAKIDRWIRAGWVSFRRYTRELHNSLKAKLLRAPEGPDDENRGSKVSPIRMLDIYPS